MANGKNINLMQSKIEQIKADASFRNFYRINSKKNSKIIVLANHEKYKNLVVYMAVNKFLSKNKILSPKVFSHNYDKGIIVIEDFGDLSFHKILSKKGKKFETYKELVNLILKIQKIKPKSKIKDIFNKSTKGQRY